MYFYHTHLIFIVCSLKYDYNIQFFFFFKYNDVQASFLRKYKETMAWEIRITEKYFLI